MQKKQSINQKEENNDDEVLENKNSGLREEGNFNNPDFKFIPSGFHEWRQQGYYIVCKSCALTHALWIGANKMLVGIDEDGKPILKTRAELGFE